VRAPTSSSRGSIAFRCDGDEQTGAGHVARCVSLAAAFARLDWEVCLVGAYNGLAAWLVARTGMHVLAPSPEAPCGIAVDACDVAVVDSYLIDPAEICQLAATLPVVTLAEANRCCALGILLDYHLDRTRQSSTRLLAGPSFAPLDPAFAGAGCTGDEVRRVLVTLGGSLAARELLAQVVPMVRSVFSSAEVIVAHHAHGAIEPDVIALPGPSDLVDAVSDVDLVVTAAGLTAYEMACAGVPQVAIAIVANQRRAARGLQNSGLAPCLDLTRGDSLTDLPRVLDPLRNAGLRRRLGKRGRATFDGQGARRAATTLTELFGEARRCA
jgi:spore coat polysaccharide biosynthesis predicted glycosyltransferase SpsG